MTDAVIIGGGHNGLVCAAYLAKAGRKVVVCEARARPGGAAATEEIHPGYRVPACAHILHLMHPKVIADLGLTRHGLDYGRRDLATISLLPDGGHLVLSPDADGRNARFVQRFDMLRYFYDRYDPHGAFRIELSVRRDPLTDDGVQVTRCAVYPLGADA